jgi:hypothetical protein
VKMSWLLIGMKASEGKHEDELISWRKGNVKTGMWDSFVSANSMEPEL